MALWPFPLFFIFLLNKVKKSPIFEIWQNTSNLLEAWAFASPKLNT
jgi:hypothetical protein